MSWFWSAGVGDANGKIANVDEVFVDLCRQIIRKDNTATSSYEDDYRKKPYRGEKDRTKRPYTGRHRGRNKHCIIL